MCSSKAILIVPLLLVTFLSKGAIAQQLSDTDIVDRAGHHFVRRSGRMLVQQGEPFRVAGASNYYPMYSSQIMVDSLLNTAAANSFNVIRFWGSLDIGNQDGSNSVDGIHNGVYFHYWNGTAPTFNDGDTGLKHLDYIIYKAGLSNLKVIIPFVNNWTAFGGMDQYVRWRGGQFHDEFYTDPQIRTWFHQWIEHLLNHTNFYTGIKYKDDATIMSWELANEPRCGGSGPSSGGYPRSSTCNTQTLISWADELSTFVKSIDQLHLLSAGDEGFYCIPGSSDWTRSCGEGVDTLALASLPNMDAISFHLYPDYWGKDVAWANQWISDHIQDSHRLGQRAVLGEFGFLDKATRNLVYKQWTDTVLTDEGAGALYWILSDKQDNGTYYPDFDGFTVYCPSPVCLAFTNFAKRIERIPNGRPSPVADNDTAATQHDVSVTLSPAANDIAYNLSAVVPGSLDLDPATAGQQTQIATNFGTYVLQAGGTVLFTPAPGFSGTASTPYVIKDVAGRESNQARLTIAVQGDPSVLYNFEDGTQTWAAANFNATAGTVAQSTNFASNGTHSLQVNGIDGGWFNPTFSAPIPLANIHHILLDIHTLGVGTSHSVSVQVGPNYTWCQTTFGFINANTTTTIDVDLGQVFASCGAPDTSVLQNINVFFSGGGTFYMDYVRTQ